MALWKNPATLTARQQTELAWIQKLNAPIYRAYLLKEQLRQIYQLPAADGIEISHSWLKWARRCRLEPFVKLAKTITDQRARVETRANQRSRRMPGSSKSTPRSA